MARIYYAGDSTVAQNTFLSYPQTGIGQALPLFLKREHIVQNHAINGRSTKSFIDQGRLASIYNDIRKDDFLFIQFGHNDEKNDDASRFTDASKPITDQTSFKYSLYENYIKLAEEKGAIPILATPIVRANKKDDYSGSSAHITSTGDYRKAIIELGQEKNVDVIDMTTLTKNYYSEIGYDEAVYLHAMTTGTSATEPNLNSVDTTQQRWLLIYLLMH